MLLDNNERKIRCCGAFVFDCLRAVYGWSLVTRYYKLKAFPFASRFHLEHIQECGGSEVMAVRETGNALWSYHRISALIIGGESLPSLWLASALFTKGRLCHSLTNLRASWRSLNDTTYLPRGLGGFLQLPSGPFSLRIFSASFPQSWSLVIGSSTLASFQCRLRSLPSDLMPFIRSTKLICPISVDTNTISSVLVFLPAIAAGPPSAINR